MTRLNNLKIVGSDHYRLYLKDSRRKEPKIERQAEYREILDFLFRRIWYYIFYENWIFQAPAKLGHFYVAEKLGKDKGYVDWQQSRKEGKKIYKKNLHSFGRKFFLRWNRDGCQNSHRYLYTIKFIREDREVNAGSRGLNKVVREFADDPNRPDFRGHII